MIGRYYCGKFCQTADWKAHKQYHKELSRRTDNADRLEPSVSSPPLKGTGSLERGSSGLTPSISMILEDDGVDGRAVERLLLAGASDASITDDQRFKALHFASYNGNLDVARILIANGPAGLVNRTTPDGVSCLFLASVNGHLETAKFLNEASGGALLLQTTLQAEGLSCLHAASL
jgi:ankyrin repeat protein